MSHRPFTAAQARQNRLFLDALARTGNARLAARMLGVNRSTYTKRRAKCPAFAARWDAALAAFQASPILPGTGRGTTRRVVEGPEAKRRDGVATRTLGGEPILTRLKNGRVQLRLARPGRMTRAAEQAFLRALSATANVRLSAAAAGFAHSSFYARARKCPAFAREMRLALGIAWERLDEAMFDAASSDAPDGGDEWRKSALPPLPPLNATQVLQLLHLHRGHGRFGLDPDLLERRRGESEAIHLERLRALTAAELARAAECAAFWEKFEEAEGEGEGEPDPQLDRVTGWSKADPNKVPHDPRRALFGGWRARSGRK